MSRTKRPPAILTVPQREKALETDLIQLLRIRGVWCQKVHSGAVFVKAGPLTYKMKLADQGTPDIIACIRGRFVGIEVKASPEEAARWQRVVDSYLATGTTEKNRTIKKSWEREVLQYLQHDLIRKAGGEIMVVGSVEELNADLDVLIKEIEESECVPMPDGVRDFLSSILLA